MNLTMAQTIRIESLKLGSRLATDVYDLREDGSRVLLFAAGQEIRSEVQLKRLLDAGLSTVPVRPESMRIGIEQIEGKALHVECVQLMRKAVDEFRPVEHEAMSLQYQIHEQARTRLDVDLEHVGADFDLRLKQARQTSDLSDVLCLMREDSPLLYRHSLNVAQRALHTAHVLDPACPDEELRRIYLAGLLHDIGLVHCLEIRSTDLKELNEDLDSHQLHPVFADQLLQPLELPGLVRRIVVEHHEVLSGQGYPNGLSGSEIHPWSLLLGLCDRHDRLIQASGYRAGLSPVVALNLMRGWAGREYPVQHVEAFLQAHGPYPLGACVLLADGRQGKVISREVSAERPLVAVPRDFGIEIVDTSLKAHSIQKGLNPQAVDLHPAELF
jgi:HD-GYP domain-containing protein (c-di-GMP phosphodiesterase class II)